MGPSEGLSLEYGSQIRPIHLVSKIKTELNEVNVCKKQAQAYKTLNPLRLNQPRRLLKNRDLENIRTQKSQMDQDPLFEEAQK